jgi:mRNA-degrading endonuclease RelE of RelBE toxin-antitoxin system
MNRVVKKITRSPSFIKQTKSLDKFSREKLKKQILKILDNPFVGKPLKYKRGERTIYIKPFRLIYALYRNELILLKFEHRKSVYKN